MQKLKKELLLFKELLANPSFIKDIKKIRKNYKISPKGLGGELEYGIFLKQLKKVKIKVIKEIFTLDAYDKPTQLNKILEIHNIELLTLEIAEILKKYDLSLEWFGYIHRFIFLNIPDRKKIYEVYLIRNKVNKTIISEHIELTIGSTFGLKDFTNKINGQTTWNNSIEPLQKIMQGYSEKSKRPSKSKTKLQRKIFLKYKSGKKDIEIASDITLPEMTPQTIRKSVSRYKKKINPND